MASTASWLPMANAVRAMAAPAASALAGFAHSTSVRITTFWITNHTAQAASTISRQRRQPLRFRSSLDMAVLLPLFIRPPPQPDHRPRHRAQADRHEHERPAPAPVESVPVDGG